MGQSRHQYDRRVFFVLGLLLIMLTGAYFRSSGLFRGLDKGVVFHPDAPKQVMALGNYLRGNYVQYFGSWFYDGYPYGLNRVDELVLRAISPFPNWVADTLTPADGLSDPSTRSVLYYYVRVLRVIYGCLTILLICLAARAGGLSRWFSLLAAVLYAIAPLGAAVTHSATGDVGVDLFVGFLLLAFALYMRTGRQGFCFLMGMSIGMAFACKYQGLLGGWLPGMFVLMEFVKKKYGWRKFVSRALLGLSGFLIGALLLIPGLWIDFDRAWDDMRINFVNIRNYNIPETFAANGFFERIQYGLSRNFMEVIDHLGSLESLIVLLVLGFAIAVVAKRVYLARRPQLRKANVSDVHNDERMLFWAIQASFVFVTLLLATALKPAVQPFHFSFLLPVMALCSAFGVSLLYGSRYRLAKLFSIVFVVVLVYQSFAGVLKEDYFWRRSELTGHGRRYADDVIGDSGYGVNRFKGDDLVKRFFAEPSRLSAFRNRGSGVRAPNPWWNEYSYLPVPAVMAGVQGNWVFMDGAQFPRDSRTLLSPAVGRGVVTRLDAEGRALVTGRFPWSSDGRILKTLVFESVPDRFFIGLRTGQFPSRYDIEVGGQRYSGFMLPDRERIIEVRQPKLDYHTLLYREVCGVGFRGESQVGPLWVSMIPDEEHLALYQAYGANASRHFQSSPVHTIPEGKWEMAKQALLDLPYLQSTESVKIGSGWQALGSGDTMVLPGGGYYLELEWNDVKEPLELEFVLRYADLKSLGQPQMFSIVGGDSITGLFFEKNFWPFEVIPSVRLRSEGEVALRSWSIRPSLDKVKQWQPTEAAVGEHNDEAFLFEMPGLGRVLAINIEPNRYCVDLVLSPDVDHRDFYETFLFIHLLNEEGEHSYVLDKPLRKCSFDSRSLWWELPAISQGEYRLIAGLFNSRTGKRFALRGGEGVRVNRDKRFAEVGMLSWPLP